MTDLISRESAWLITLLLMALMLAAWGGGWQWGKRLLQRGDKTEAGKAEEATLALMGLLLAFTFSMALEKHSQRRAMSVSDANAIGDYYTAVSMLPEPRRKELQTLVRRYTEHRLDLATRSLTNDASLATGIDEINAMQDRMTELTRAAIEAGTPVAVPLVDTLNGVTSSTASRLWAAQDRLPWPVLLLLSLSTLVSLAFVGRGQAVSGKAHPLATVGLIIMLALVVYVTLDLNQPQHGLIRVGQEPMERLLKTMPE